MPEEMKATALRDKAAKCRRLANGMADDQTIAALLRLAEAYDRQAEEAQSAGAAHIEQIMPRMAE